MTDRSRSMIYTRGSNGVGVSRRDVLRMGSAIGAAGILLPSWMTANAQSVTTFDYYVSPTGSDSNPGTLASPWAITSLSLFSHTAKNVANCNLTGGKRVGFLPGTYDVSGLMFNDPVSGALQMIGGSSSASTYWASSDASGNYSPRTATLDAKGASNLFGGHVGGSGVWDGPIISHVGHYPTTYAVGWAIIDGLRLTGFSYKAIRVGGLSSGDGAAITNPVTIQNCEVTGGGANVGDGLDNYAAIWIDGTINCATVTNNYVHDTLSWHYYNGNGSMSQDHLNAIILWGFGASNRGSVIQYNTVVNAGSIYGKEGGVQGSIVRYNYNDCSMYTSGAYGIEDFTGNAQGVTGLTDTTSIYNNIILCPNFGIQGVGTLSNAAGFETPVHIYNNTIIMNGGGSGTPAAIWVISTPAGAGGQQVYNNIVQGQGVTTNPSAPSIWDYNLYSGSPKWALMSNSNLASQTASYSSASAFASGLASNGGISGAEAHSISGTPAFLGTGTFAALYQLTAASPGKGQGSTTGTSSGQATDMGAWGNGATQIGSNFAAGSAIPNAPSLTVS
jgi:hypothetical protein